MRMSVCECECEYNIIKDKSEDFQKKKPEIEI